MPKDATQRVLDLRQRVDAAKTRTTTLRAHQQTAEDALAAADDAIVRLELDPDRDLERQVNKLADEIETDLHKLEGYLDEAESILAGS
mgnify:FL=1